MKKNITIAIDGYSSCGKSTLAKALAKELNYVFIDTGAMYRAVCYYALHNGIIQNGVIQQASLITSLPNIQIAFGELNTLTEARAILLNGIDISSEIRSLEIAQSVSKIAAIKEVRQKLVHIQQQLGETGGVVMDGRDIGTVVFPNAELKLFLTASIEVRTQRRLLEMRVSDPNVDEKAVAANLQERDHMDSTREESPLKQAEDAIVIDNSDLNQGEQLELAMNFVENLL